MSHRQWTRRVDTRSKYQSFLIQYYAGVARDLPTISPFAHELARLPRTQVPSPEQLTRAFQTDPFLAAKLTGASNSVFFAHDHFAVLTVPEALKRVGRRYAMNLVREAPPLPLNVGFTDIAPLWAHCMAVAHVATSIAASVPSAPFDPEVTHLVAMIHDIGYLLQLSYSPNTWEDIATRLEHEECDTDNTPHEIQGEELARFWSLPIAAVAAIRSHHEPHSCSDPRARWLSSVIALSEALLRRTLSPAQIAADEWPAETLRNDLRLPLELLIQLRKDGLQILEQCMALPYQPSTTRFVPRLKLIRTGGKDE